MPEFRKDFKFNATLMESVLLSAYSLQKILHEEIGAISPLTWSMRKARTMLRASEEFLSAFATRGFIEEQMTNPKKIEQFSEERLKEIEQVAKSVHELAQIMNDLCLCDYDRPTQCPTPL